MSRTPNERALLRAVFRALDEGPAIVARYDAERAAEKRAEDAVLRKTGADFVSDDFREEVIEALIDEGWSSEAALNKTRTQALLLAEADRLGV